MLNLPIFCYTLRLAPGCRAINKKAAGTALSGSSPSDLPALSICARSQALLGRRQIFESLVPKALTVEAFQLNRIEEPEERFVQPAYCPGAHRH